MVPTYSTKPGGRRYRYYASQSRLQGKPTRASISRVPAAPLEEIITGRLARFRLIAPRAPPRNGVFSLMARAARAVR